MFVDIFIPNIELNCLDMTCNMVRNPIEENSYNTITEFKKLLLMVKIPSLIDLEDYQLSIMWKNKWKIRNTNKKENKQEMEKKSKKSRMKMNNKEKKKKKKIQNNLKKIKKTDLMK